MYRLIPVDTVQRIATALLAERCVLVVDEVRQTSDQFSAPLFSSLMFVVFIILVLLKAYIDFAEDVASASAVSLVKTQNFPNVIVLQTLSKAFGLAGIRLGMAIASPEIVQVCTNACISFSQHSASCLSGDEQR